MNTQSESEQFNPIAKPRMADFVAWAYPATLFIFALATVAQCALFNKSAFALQRAQYWLDTPFTLKTSLIVCLAMITASPLAVIAAAFMQLRNDGSDTKLRFQHFGMTIAGIFVAVIGLAVLQPGVMDGFSDGDWLKLFFGV